MTTKKQFSQKAKMRHDFSDQIMVRYTHGNGEHYDTWVSGEELLQRLKSTASEAQIRALIELDINKMKDNLRGYVEEKKEEEKKSLFGRLANTVSDFVGDNPIGDEIVDKIRARGGYSEADEKEVWQKRLEEAAFRNLAIELAWIQIGDTLPPADKDEEFNDWV